MPVIPRQRLAARLRQNWSAMYPTETNQTSMMEFQIVDDSLTSLAWLQNLNIIKLSSNSSSSSSQWSAMVPVASEDRVHADPAASRSALNRCDGFNEDAAAAAALSRLPVDPNDILDMSGKRGPPSSFFAAPADEVAVTANRLERDRYKYDASIKPPYSYAILICMAMQEKPDTHITLSQIYNWIADNFAYYRHADQNWQHSIRHNLSLNKCFQKVPRGKDEPGKGGYWTINPDFYSLIDRGIFKKKRPAALGDNSNAVAFLTFKRETNKVEEVTTFPPAASNRCHDTERSPPQKKRKEVRAYKGHAISPSDPFWSNGTESLTDTLNASWSNVFNQDIDVGGVSVKTADILVNLETTAAVGSISLASSSLESPPPSSIDDNDSDLDMEALLRSACPPSVDPVTPRSGDPLDLTIHGIGLQPPDWWNESLNGHFPATGEEGLFLSSSTSLLQQTNDGRMHTPSLMPFRDSDDNFHPWAENREALIGFDAGSVILDTDNVDSFKLF